MSFFRKYVTVLVAFSLFLVTVGVPLLYPHPAHATALTTLSDTLSTAKISTLSSHTIKFTTPTGTSTAGQTIILTFPSDYAFTSKAISTVTFTHGSSTGAENTETLAASASATAWGAVFSGTANRVFTLTAPTDGVGASALAASDKIIITYDSTNSTNPTVAGSYDMTIAGTFTDTGDITTQILNDDAVAVTATVTQTLSFAISDTTIGFGTLAVANARYATGDLAGSTTSTDSAHTLTAATNAVSGYTITVKGATLAAGTPTITAIGSSNTASSAGTEQFGVRFTVSGGSGTVTAPYAAAGWAYAADGTTTSQVASSSTSSATSTFSAIYIANIAATTEPGAYTATLLYVATANF